MRLLFVLCLALASGASAQPLDIARIDAPASVDSGDNVRIMLTVDVHNRSDSNKRYALMAVVDGAERDRWTSTSALVPGASERVPLAWTQAVSGSALRGDVVLLNTRGIELARESFEIAVARGETPEGPPVVTVVTPPVGHRPVPGVPRPEIPGGVPERTYTARPVQVDTTPLPLAQIDIGFGAGSFEGLTARDAGPCQLRAGTRTFLQTGRFTFPGSLTLRASVTNRGETPIRHSLSTTFQLLITRPDGATHVGDIYRGLVDLASDPLSPGASRVIAFSTVSQEDDLEALYRTGSDDVLTLIGALRPTVDTDARDNQIRVRFVVSGRESSPTVGTVASPLFSTLSCAVERLP